MTEDEQQLIQSWAESPVIVVSAETMAALQQAIEGEPDIVAPLVELMRQQAVRDEQ